MTELEQTHAKNEALRNRVAELEQQLDWLKRQLFGRKSERVPEGKVIWGLFWKRTRKIKKKLPRSRR